MHEILHTYHFLSLRRKNTFPSFHASWRKSFLYHKNLFTALMKNIQTSWNILRSYKKVLYCLSNEATLRLDSSCALARFSLFQNMLRRSTLYPLLVPDALCCMMLMLCKKWCDDVMLCKVIFRRYTHICAIKHNLFVNQRWLFAISLP